VSPIDPDAVANYAADLARSDPDIALMIGDVKKIDHLREDAGWQTLRRRVVEQKDKFMLKMARGLMAGNVADQRQIDYMRGYYAGSLDVVNIPMQAAESLERAAVKAYRKALFEEAEGAEAPYL
jgi:hypothetical protein